MDYWFPEAIIWDKALNLGVVVSFMWYFMVLYYSENFFKINCESIY